MRDNLARRLLKAVARWAYQGDLALARGVQRLRHGQTYQLRGSCNGCGLCCLAPTIRPAWLIFHLAPLRRLFLFWQSRVNGFQLVRSDRSSRLLVFHCDHYDPVTRLCDSYASRPGMCRDYPKNLLDQANPEFFDECSHYAELKGAASFRAALNKYPMTEAQREALERKLHIHK